MRVVLVDCIFEPTTELKLFESENANSGAIATFMGRCRPRTSGEDVTALELQHYPNFTEQQISRFVQDICCSKRLHDALVIHRVGAISPGEAIVLVACASDHRAEALAAVETIIDFLKTDAPLWKREVTNNGAQWVEPTALDYQRQISRIAKS
ncbi:MAG TPA: molybdenum cofactor biosynthesis protein MoaE [Vitreimonas sp.]|jgi:molybdopterin synthase catalytic subunit|nr:molybdenum cofactor biosynthesis protein MoaE [Vitreimonas sp.]